jgi:hypothetical protein
MQESSSKRTAALHEKMSDQRSRKDKRAFI